jgi:hypothetical protein
MTRDEYEKIISSYLMELQGIIAALRDDHLLDSLELIAEIEEFKKRMGDPKISDADFVGFCFGIVDQYIHDFWKDTISDGFDLYRDLYITKHSPPEI